MNCCFVMNPTKNDPQSNDERVVERTNNVASDPTDNVPDQSVAVGGIGPRLNVRVPIQRRRFATTFQFGVNIGFADLQFLGDLVTLPTIR